MRNVDGQIEQNLKLSQKRKQSFLGSDSYGNLLYILKKQHKFD